MKIGFLSLIFSLFLVSATVADNPIVRMQTSEGDIIVELFRDKAPVTVSNFLNYVQDGFYSQVIFHRVVPNFIIQSGGFESGLQQLQTRPPIVSESQNGLSNTRGTIGMARTAKVNSATSEFYFNLKDNSEDLDHKHSISSSGYGYAVFGQIIDGLDVMDKIGKVKTHTIDGFKDVPVEDVVIYSMNILKE